jgi:type IV secretory pathway TraG/TraD family ATPase VirD4
MAAALIPQHGDGDPFWVQAARTIFASTAYKMRADRDRSTERLLELMLNDKLESLGRYLEGTESAALVSEKIEKTAISIKSVLAAYIKSLRFLEQLDAQGEDGQPLRQCFSIRDWVKDDTQRGFLFLSSHAQQHASLRPLLSMWLTMACTAMLANKPDPNRRLWVIIDEAPSLHKIPELLDTIAEVRKFGGCFVIGMQSIAQLRQVYGEHGAKALFDLLNTRLFFRAPSFAMAKLASEELGEQEVDISREQYSYGANTIRDGISLGHQTTTRPVVSASEIMQLDDLQCWLRTPGDYPITKLTLRFDPIKARHAPFIQRDYQTSDSMAAIDQLLTWSQVGALDKLDTATRNPLLRRFQHDFSGEQERQAEQSRMHATLSTSSLTSSSAHNKPSAAPGSDDHSAVTSHATDSEAIDESPSIDTPDTTQPSSVVATRDLDNTPTRPSSLMPDDQDATAMITQEEQNILGIGD